MFDLTSNQFSSNFIEVGESYVICPLISPGSYMMKSMSDYRLVLADVHGNITDTILDCYDIKDETMIPISSTEVLVLDARIKHECSFVRCSSLFLCTLDPLDINALGTFACLSGIICSWAVIEREVYTLRNTNIITWTSLDKGLMKVVFHERHYNSVKGFLFWLHAKKLPIKQVHVKYILSLLQPPDSEETYSTIKRARDAFI
mmetsp:Transcript_32224/g.55717  ORF Transcript_32224/g.55717 Transcript_32224/m.55717 type:complete len:203 (+) Transcript_32224:421-1029(+)